MKKILLILAFSFVASLNAQSQYDQGMTKAFTLWQTQKTSEAAQLFERIATAEKDNWLPPFYAAELIIIDCFSIKDEAVLTAKLNKAQQFLDKASAISQNNPEIIITQALLNTAYIAFDGQKYGMTLSAKNTALYEKALQIAPNNPRVVMAKAEWGMGSAKYFGQSIEPYCKNIKKAIELFKKEKPAGKYYPHGGIERAQEVLKQCQN